MSYCYLPYRPGDTNHQNNRKATRKLFFHLTVSGQLVLPKIHKTYKIQDAFEVLHIKLIEGGVKDDYIVIVSYE
jgi:hypothetical protein